MTTMSIRAYTFALLGAVSLSLLAHDAQSQDYPPAFPREGARQVSTTCGLPRGTTRGFQTNQRRCIATSMTTSDGRKVRLMGRPVTRPLDGRN